MKRARLAILISGRGRNLRALMAAVAAGNIQADIVGVIADRPGTEGLAAARDAGLSVEEIPHAHFPERSAFDSALAARLHEAAPDIVALAGFMRVLGNEFVNEFEGRMLNIHPSLLPRHAGLHTHRRVLQAGDAEHGATVHFVTTELDGGARVIQGGLSLRPDDSEGSLAERVLSEIELKIYPQALAWMARGDLQLQAGRAMFRGRALQQPLGLNDLEDAFR